MGRRWPLDLSVPSPVVWPPFANAAAATQGHCLMTNWKDFKVERSPQERKERRTRLLVTIFGGLLILGIFGGIYWHQESEIDVLLAELEEARQTPPGRPLPTGWEREERSGYTRYYSPLQHNNVVNQVTGPGVELPDGVSAETHHPLRRGRRTVIFTVRE